MNKRYAIIEKRIGETPLIAIEAFRERERIEKDVPLAYAGRLDPLASGKLIVLIGEECKKQKEYHAFDKEYVFEVLLSCSSDTGDVLGIAHYQHTLKEPADSEIQAAVKKFIGTHELPYPKYSSKTINGKPLFLWTLEGRLDEIEIPTVMTTIYSITLEERITITRDELAARIEEKISSIPEVTDERKQLGNDFRREDIRGQWKAIFSAIPKDTKFTILRIRTICASGTYIRTLAGLIGDALGSKGLAFSIHRSKIGTYRHFKPPFGLPAFGLWKKTL